MKSRSFFTKLLLGNLLLIAMIVAIAGFVSYRQLNETYLAENEAHQLRVLNLARRFAEEFWAARGEDVDFIDRQCKELMADSAMRLTVIADDGRVLGDSEADPRKMGNHKTASRPEILAALGGSPGRAVHPSGTLGVAFRYLALPIRHEGRVVGAVRVAMPVVAILRSRNFIRSALLWAAGAAAAAAVVLALMLSWLWYAPLRQITRTARTLAAGDLAQRASISGSDELSQLAAALNEMRDSISRKIAQIAAQRKDLVDVVENLREGVVALDAQGRIALMNASAVELLGADGDASPTGKHFQSVARVADIVGICNEAFREGRPVARHVEAEIRGRRYVLDVQASPLAGHPAEGLATLLVVRDITHLVRMAAMKAEFVANASHELRTPLATIRAAVDSLATLEPGETEELARLAAILDRHTTRLEEMTRDLLSLHMVESGGHRPRLEPVDLARLAEWVREGFATRAEQKGVALDVMREEPSAELRSDVMLLQLILQNLLDNAVKFTPPGGRVTCRFQPDATGGRVLLTVRDTGCGMPPEIQDRVFERFFQADTSRSGQPRIRGTGLGLAIVKHAAERLGASIRLQSAVGQGTTVTVAVPRHEGA